MRVTRQTKLSELQRIAKARKPDPENLVRSMFQSLRAAGVKISYKAVRDVVYRNLRCTSAV